MQLCGRCLPRMHKDLNSISGMGRRVEQDRQDPQNKYHRLTQGSHHQSSGIYKLPSLANPTEADLPPKFNFSSL